MAKLKQQDKCPSESLPSSLLHYTSMDTFMKIIKDSSNGFLHFHASHGRLMNDKAEGAFFFDKLFLTSEESKRKVEKPIKEFMQTSGEYYIISLSRTRAKSPSGLSAMWYEYADRGKGVMLRFDYKTLKERAASGAFVISKCDYLTSSKVDEAVKKSRKLLKQ